MRAGLFALLLVLCGGARADDGGVNPVDGPVATRAAKGFVHAEGTRFVVDGRPFVFVGANVNALQGAAVRARYKDTLAALADDGLTVARVWAFAEGPADASEWLRREHLFRAGPGPEGYIEAAYLHLDAVVAEAGRRGIRLIITLANNWSDYGGVPMYLHWAGLPEGHDFQDAAREAFYSDPRVRGFFQDGVARLLDRVNTVTGVRYADDPAIFSWELMNESVVVTAAGALARRAWVAEMASFIKQRDPHHMVAAGLGTYATRRERSDWIATHRLPQIDYCDSHLYLQGERRVKSERELDQQIDDRAQLALFVVKKPLVIGEFGFRTDAAGDWLGARRDAWFRRLLARALDDGAAGALAWIYQPWSGAARDFGIYVDRDDTRDVRAVMRELAARAAALPSPTNPLLGAAVGERFLYDPLMEQRQELAPASHAHRTALGMVVTIAPDHFALARFESLGQSAGGALPHIYGGGWGRVVYRFTSPSLSPAGHAAAVPRRVRIGARLSSEWPGFAAPANLSAAEAGSRVALLVDGRRVATLFAPPDDGAGRWREVTLTDPALLHALASGTHTLTFALPDSPASHGLCIYGAPKKGGPAPAGETGPIRLWFDF